MAAKNVLTWLLSRVDAGVPPSQLAHEFVSMNNTSTDMDSSEMQRVIEAMTTFIDKASEGDNARAKFVEEARFDPPRFLRVIDCKLSVQEQAVVIVNYDLHQEAGSSNRANTHIGGYTTISHTFGDDVYAVFDCACAADCRASEPRADPAKSTCKHYEEEDLELQKRVIADVQGMCGLLVAAGVRYAWHDGVCIAQYNEEEVHHFIEHMAWIYANANDTVIFLHYIGRPMAPIAPPSYQDGPVSRWETRVWTYQEAAFSKRRRYCVRRGKSLKDFGENWEQGLASWYEPGGPNSITIIDEPEFLDLCQGLLKVVSPSISSYHAGWRLENEIKLKLKWGFCLLTLRDFIQSLRSSFPTIIDALSSLSDRESTHEGDRINSILGLMGVKEFSAPKDDRVEESTLEFFKRTGKAGLTIAFFTINFYADAQNGRAHTFRARAHTWYPSLCLPLSFTPIHLNVRKGAASFHTDHLEFEVRSEDGSLEVRGPLVCVSIGVTIIAAEDTGSLVTRTCAQMKGSLSAFEDEMILDGRRHSEGSIVLHATKDNLVLMLGTAMRTLFRHPDFNEAMGENESFRSLEYMASVRSSDWSGIGSWKCRAAEETHCTYNLIFPRQVLEWSSDFPTYDENMVLSSNSPSHTIVETLNERVKLLWKSNNSSFLAVMVRGDVQGVVEKVGFFVASPMFLHVLAEHRYTEDYITFIDKLVIK